jgi:putative RecB family exonuclease
LSNPQLPDHLSYSQINTYLSCPLKYQLHYVDRIKPEFLAASLAFGSGIHEAVAALYQERLIGDCLRIDQLVDIYRQAWINRENENIRFFNGDNFESLLEKAQQLLEVFFFRLDPGMTVIGVEEFFQIEIEDCPPLQGYIDLIEQDQDGTTTIADLKTAARKPPASQADQSLQLICYSLGAQYFGFDPERLNLRLDVLTKTKNPELVRLETTRTDEDRRRFIRLVRHVWNAIEREAFFPKKDWHCSQCCYQTACQKW